MEQRVASKDREIASFQRQLQAVEQNLNAISHEKDDVLEQFNHLNGDLMTMTKENQVILQFYPSIHCPTLHPILSVCLFHLFYVCT